MDENSACDELLAKAREEIMKVNKIFETNSATIVGQNLQETPQAPTDEVGEDEDSASDGTPSLMDERDADAPNPAAKSLKQP